MLWVCISIRVRCITLCDKFVSDLRQVVGFLQISSTNKTDCHDITEIWLKMALNTIKQTYNLSENYIQFLCPFCCSSILMRKVSAEIFLGDFYKPTKEHVYLSICLIVRPTSSSLSSWSSDPSSSASSSSTV